MRVKLPSGVVRGLSLWLGGLLLASAGLGKVDGEHDGGKAGGRLQEMTA